MNYQVIEETRMVGEFFMSSRKFNPAKLLKLLLKLLIERTMIIYEYFIGLRSNQANCWYYQIMERRNIIRWEYFMSMGYLNPSQTA